MRRLAALLLVGALAGCETVGAGAGSSGGMNADVRRALRGLQSDYENVRSEYFFERFDQGRYPNFISFRDRVKTFLLRAKTVNMRLIVDTVVEDKGELSADVRWNRSYVDENGSHRLEEGSAEFLFNRRESGGLAVVDIRGQSPF